MSSTRTLELSSMARMEQLLVRMRLWEGALQNHFQGRTREDLSSNPTWIKLKKVKNIGLGRA